MDGAVDENGNAVKRKKFLTPDDEDFDPDAPDGGYAKKR